MWLKCFNFLQAFSKAVLKWSLVVFMLCNCIKKYYQMLGVTQKETVSALLLLAIRLLYQTSQFSAYALIWVKSSFSCFVAFRASPSMIYTNKTGDCLSVYLFVCLSVRAMGGQTARPNRLKFGG